jgi:hypothetical protein
MFIASSQFRLRFNVAETDKDDAGVRIIIIRLKFKTALKLEALGPSFSEAILISSLR